ncbi:hypothetical protein DL95DRAFT_389516 [Leptodontidium sp. 2 PMI_412]|nr:hypothetical protein DL95DRAFT_389516 [Leptodontidium sp. 2 PMI_412]
MPHSAPPKPSTSTSNPALAFLKTWVPLFSIAISCTFVILYLTGCIVTETSITSYTKPTTSAAKSHEDSSKAAFLEQEGEEITKCEMRWWTTKIRFWRWELVLWSIGGK